MSVTLVVPMFVKCFKAAACEPMFPASGRSVRCELSVFPVSTTNSDSSVVALVILELATKPLRYGDKLLSVRPRIKPHCLPATQAVGDHFYSIRPMIMTTVVMTPVIMTAVAMVILAV